MTTIKDNLAGVELQILQACKQANRPRSAITLLAVSKTKPQALIEQAYQAGQRAFGESYARYFKDHINFANSTDSRLRYQRR